MLKPFSTGRKRILSMRSCDRMNEPMKRNLHLGLNSIKASLESNYRASCSNSVRNSYGTKPPSTMKLFMKVTKGYGKTFFVEFYIRFSNIVLTLIFKSKNRSFLTLSLIIELSKGMKSIDKSGFLMIVRTGVLTHLITHPRRTSL